MNTQKFSNSVFESVIPALPAWDEPRGFFTSDIGSEAIAEHNFDDIPPAHWARARQYAARICRRIAASLRDIVREGLWNRTFSECDTFAEEVLKSLSMALVLWKAKAPMTPRGLALVVYAQRVYSMVRS